MSLKERLKKNTVVKEADILSNSKIFDLGEPIPTCVPALNIALSGDIEGGLLPGFSMVAAPSKHFKSALALTMAKAYLDKYPDSMLLFYDSEFGTPKSYFDAFDIDSERVFHVPLKDIETLSADVMKQIEGFEPDDHVVIVVDSLGQAPSAKEVNDALEDKAEKVDMTRAKQIKSFFRMTNSRLVMKKIPMIIVNHVYVPPEMYAKPKMSGGSGNEYSPNAVIMIGRTTEKDTKTKEVVGYEFTMRLEKSRFVKEGSTIPLTVTFDGGINKYSGLLELAIEAKMIDNSKQGWYAKINQETGEVMKNVRKADTNNEEFWSDILDSEKFKKFITDKYKIGSIKMLSDSEISKQYGD